ncbi:DUF4326 domain-containing protein [Microbacterium sp. NPDC080220]|uniref:DUF4326 domain-containing protein n=1 Tax=Microbacterium sp. NPDC080220 TaxID=3161017 RepID=UPI00341431F7
MPERIQQRRTKGWRKPENTVIVSRSSQWGNPFRVGQSVRRGVYEFTDDDSYVFVKDRAHAVALYREWLVGRADVRARILRNLRGKNLACWCPEGEPCHADVLLEIANA